MKGPVCGVGTLKLRENRRVVTVVWNPSPSVTNRLYPNAENPFLDLDLGPKYDLYTSWTAKLQSLLLLADIDGAMA